VQVGKANEVYAQELGKLGKDLTDVEKKQAFLNATVLAGEDLMRRLGKQTKTTAEMFQSFEAFVTNAKVALSKGLLVAVKWVVMAFTQAGKVINQTLGQITGGWGMIFGLVGKLPGGEMLGFKALSANLKSISENFNLAAEKANKFTLELLEVQQSSGAAFTGGGSAAGPGTPSSPDQAKSIAEQVVSSWNEVISESETLGLSYFFRRDQGLLEVDRQNELERLRVFGEQRIELIQTEHDVALWMMQEKQRKELAIEEHTTKMRKWGQQQLVGNAIKTGKLIMDISGKQNKALFRAVQAVSAGKAAIYAYQSAAKAMAEVPWPLNVAVAASNLAFGMAQVANIMAQSPGGGAAAAGVPAVSTSTAPVYTPYPGGAVAGTEARATTNIYIENFVGEESWIDYLIEKLNQAGEARDVYIYASHARTAEELGY